MTAAQRRGLSAEDGTANWKCFPPPYVMDTEKQRSRRQTRNRNQNLSQSYSSTPRQWEEEPFRRPATATPAINHESAHTAIRPTRSRSRLQKRPSQLTLKHSAKGSTMSQSFSRSQGLSSDQQDITALPNLPDQVIPNRSSSFRKKSPAGFSDRPRPKKAHPEELKTAPPGHGSLSIRPKTSPPQKNSNRDPENDESSSSGPAQSPTNLPRTPRYQPLAPNDPSPLNPRYHIPISYFSNGANSESTQSAIPPTVNMTPAQKSEHVLLPSGFRPGKTEHTEVEEVIIPAITHEVVKHNKTEIVQEEITREIHVHHYYTYTQPIKAVEILPARHFIVDTQTGEKVEIPAPEGWVMPPNLQPYKPDTSGIELMTRHYLVDEQHPSGVLEPAPLNVRKEPQPDLGKKASMSGNWTPFPKVR